MLPCCQYVLDSFRNAVNDQDDNAIIPMIDALAESGDSSAEELADIFHQWLNTKTYVRMTVPKDELFEKLCDWNARYTDNASVKAIETMPKERGCFSRAIGDMYTRLELSVKALNFNPRVLSSHPIRELVLTNCAGEEKALINVLGNYRVKKLWTLRIQGTSFRSFCLYIIDNFKKVAPMKALRELHIDGAADPSFMLSNTILASGKLNKGCEVWIRGHKYTVK